MCASSLVKSRVVMALALMRLSATANTKRRW
jgi:hypothetical protein